MKIRRRKILTSERIVIIGFSALILLGALLLALPIASDGKTSFLDALFTSTSASCVTGLIVFDTGMHFTLFGKTVIMFLIQIGGMGVITMTVLAFIVFRKRIGLAQRNLMKSSISADRLGDIISLTGFFVSTSVIIELLGAVAFMFDFIPRYGLWRGVGYSVFHSVSAFCNAGFDILVNKKQPFSSLCEYTDNPIVNITVMLLIIIGGLGFLSWDDIKKHKFRFKKYRLQTKVIFVMTAVLIFVPAILFFFFEFSKLSGKERVLASLFQSVTLRTAGFNTVDFATVSESGKMMMIVLMLIGGAPGSTAGGMKVTTVFVLATSVMSVFKKKSSADGFGRRIPENVVKNAAAVFFLYFSLFLIGAMIISRAEALPLLDCMFETASAIGTVGLTVGITPYLSAVSKCVLIGLMFLGRVGGLTLVFATFAQSDDNKKLPQENITVG